MRAKLLIVAIAACSSQPERLACSPDVLATLELAYVTEAADACRGYTYDDCPALPGLRAKYRAKREEWVECR
jgi:hypothetical protein